jgi:hypothetical protein
MGPKKRDRFWTQIPSPKMVSLSDHRNQAHAVWQWYNCCAARVPAGKRPLRINLDETSVCLFQGGGKGTIAFKRRRDHPSEEPHERASRAKRRCCLTHVAFICERPELQPLLPQVIVGNQATFLVRDFAALQAAAPRNVHLVRQKSAWNNKELMARIISMLALALRGHFAEWQPILLLDASRVHLHAMVFSRCIANNIWPIVVPAKLTWLLQPCDTHAFAGFKIFLRKAYQAARAQAASQELNVAEFLACLYSAIRSVLQGTVWDTAFDADGFGHRQERLRNFIQRNLNMSDPLHLPDSLPTEELLKHCFPRGARVPHQILLRPLQPRALPAALPKAPVGRRLALLPRPSAASSSTGAAAIPGASAGWAPRTRADHRLVAALAKAKPHP